MTKPRPCLAHFRVSIFPSVSPSASQSDLGRGQKPPPASVVQNPPPAALLLLLLLRSIPPPPLRRSLSLSKVYSLGASQSARALLASGGFPGACFGRPRVRIRRRRVESAPPRSAGRV